MFLEKRIPFALRAHELLVPLGLRPRGTSDDVPRCRVVLSSIVVFKIPCFQTGLSFGYIDCANKTVPLCAGKSMGMSTVDKIEKGAPIKESFVENARDFADMGKRYVEISQISHNKRHTD